MSQHYKQMQQSGDAARGLRERLAREEIGDEAYERQASYTDQRAFRIFGLVFIILFAAAVFGLSWLGY